VAHELVRRRMVSALMARATWDDVSEALGMPADEAKQTYPISDTPDSNWGWGLCNSHGPGAHRLVALLRKQTIVSAQTPICVCVRHAMTIRTVAPPTATKSAAFHRYGDTAAAITAATTTTIPTSNGRTCTISMLPSLECLDG